MSRFNSATTDQTRIKNLADGYTASQTALDTVETQQQLKSDSPEVLWIGTLTGSFNPTTAPDKTSTDNDPRTKVVRKADLEQLIVQKKMIDGGTVPVIFSNQLCRQYLNE